MDQNLYSDTGDTSSSPTIPQQPVTTNSSEAETPKSETSMTKLTEVFMTAALAFQRLGELTQTIHAVGETKWTENDAKKLSTALEKFQEECAEVTQNLQARTGKMIRTDFKRRTINQYHQQQATAAAQASASSVASSSYASASPSQYNGSSPATPGPGYSYQAQRIIPTYPMHQKVGLPSTSYSVGQKRPSQGLSGIPVKRIVGGTTFRPVSNATLISQPSSSAYRK